MADEHIPIGDAPPNEARVPRALMAYSLFAPRRQPAGQILAHDDGSLRIEASAVRGAVATTWDKDVLIYLVSLALGRLRRGLSADSVLDAPWEDFRALGSVPGRRLRLDAAEGALARLQGTRVVASAPFAGLRAGEEGRLLDMARLRPGRGASCRVEAVLSPWVAGMVAGGGETLAYGAAYFGLPAFERRLYEAARLLCGDRPRAEAVMGELRRVMGTPMPPGAFRRRVLAVVGQPLAPCAGPAQLGCYGLAAARPAGEAGGEDTLVCFWRPGRVAG